MEHFLKENAAIAFQILIAVFFLLRTTKTFIAFLTSYTTLKYTNIKSVKRKAEQPTLEAFIMDRRSSHSYFMQYFFLVYQMCRVAIMLRLCLTFRFF